MAIVERYVTADALGGGSGTIGSPWTLAEAMGSAATGDRINIKKGAYTLSADMTVSGAGTVATPIILRGYNVTPGDLTVSACQDPKTLKLNTTNFPFIDGGSLYRYISKNYTILEGLKVTSTIAGEATVSIDHIGCLVRLCSINHTSNTTSNRAADAGFVGSAFVNCEIIASGAGSSGLAGLYASAACHVYGCYVEARTTSATGGAVNLAAAGSSIVNSVIVSASTHGLFLNNTTPYHVIAGNTIRVPSGSNHIHLYNVAATYAPLIVNNMLTDGNASWYNANSGTSHRPVFRIGNRTRDNAAADNGSDDWPIYSAVTTDTGGPESDYVDSVGGTDYRLVKDSPAIGTSILGSQDVGPLKYPAFGSLATRLVGRGPR